MAITWSGDTVRLSKLGSDLSSAHVCAGCKNCANVCSKVFEIEEDYGRARVYNQSGNGELIQEAIDSW